MTKEDIVNEAVAHHTPNRRPGRLWLVVALVLMLISVGIGGYGLASAQDDESAAQQNAATAKRHASAAIGVARRVAGKAQVLEDQVKALGGDPAVNVPAPGNLPDVIPGLAGQQGLPGLPGRPPSPQEILAALASFCADTGGCRGEDGRDVTPTQVAAAVATYCNARGECRGPRGLAGQPGADSTVPGPKGDTGATGAPGPPPTAEQVQAGVTAYCDAHNGCAGPQGPPPTDAQIAQAVADFCGRAGEPCRGPAGPQGQQGPAGQSAFPFTFTFQPTPGQSTTCTINSPTDFSCDTQPTGGP